MRGVARGCIAALVSLALLASTAHARADDLSSEASSSARTWPATVTGAALLGGAEPRSRGLALPTLSAPLPGPPPWANARLDKGAKIIIIVAACVVGALLLFATVKIASHNDPF